MKKDKPWINKKPIMYEFEVTFFDELDTDEDHPYGKSSIHHGITYGRSAAEAIANIEENYWDCVEDIKIHILQPSKIYCIETDGKALIGETIKSL